MIAPWNEMFVYNVKEQTAEESMDVLDRNGLSISVDVTVRFHPLQTKIGYVHEKFGRNYITVLVIPEVRSVVRQVMGRFSAEEIYSTKRAEVEQTIIDETADLNDAATKIAASKTFDNATSCSSENSLVVVEPIYEQMIAALANAVFS